jgi:heme/copper-type cytochrome/quinol oxidase subunit 4
MKDLREYAKQTNVRLALGAFILLFVVGVGLIWLIYGGNAASMGFLCLLAALFPVILILLIFVAIEWILKRARPE